MLEKYEENFSPERFLKGVMARKQLNKKSALQMCRREIPKEGYYQDKIKKGLKRRYRAAFVRKISQAQYSEGGTPDIMCIVDGHYFGFEIKRPLVGTPTKLQENAIRGIREAGGTAAIVSWPEECYKIIDSWRNGVK